MFCSKCGREMKNGEQFCSGCGTKAGSTGNFVNFNISGEDVKNKAGEMKKMAVSGADSPNKNFLMLLGNIILLIFSFIFAMTRVFTATSFWVAKQSLSMFEEVEVCRAICVILYLVSIVFMLMSLFVKKQSKGYFLPAKITMILTFVWFLFYYIIAKDSLSGYGSAAEVSISASGWFFVIFTLCACVMCYKNTYDIKHKRLKASTPATSGRVCTNCGNMINGNFAFCKSCGAPAANGGVNPAQVQNFMNNGTNSCICPNCGAQIPDGVSFCNGCGTGVR